MLRDESGVDKTVQITVQHAKHVSLLLAGPMVLHHLIRRQHVGADLVAESVVPQAGSILVALGLPFFLFPLEDLPDEHSISEGVDIRDTRASWQLSYFYSSKQLTARYFIDANDGAAYAIYVRRCNRHEQEEYITTAAKS